MSDNNSAVTQTKEPLDRRVSFRASGRDVDKMDYYAARENLNRSEFVYDAVIHYMKFINDDYDLPRAEIARTNEMIEVVKSMQVSNQNLSEVVTNGINAIMNMARGANYLDDEESGDL